MIALIDYGAGNLTSVKKALTAIGVRFIVPDTPEQCAGVAGLIVPGVGHFSATSALSKPWHEAIGSAVRNRIPLLGICVGMQWLFEGSEEAPDIPGIHLLEGRIRLLRGDPAQRMKIPHVGWNALEMPRPSRLLAGVASGSYVYFTHSFAAPVTSDCIASTVHAEAFAAAVERDNVFGVQFHPEKSGETGLQVLRNFLELCGVC